MADTPFAALDEPLNALRAFVNADDDLPQSARVNARRLFARLDEALDAARTSWEAMLQDILDEQTSRFLQDDRFTHPELFAAPR